MCQLKLATPRAAASQLLDFLNMPACFSVVAQMGLFPEKDCLG